MLNIEPPADLRVAATTLFSAKVAFVQAGFTEEEAMRLVVSMFQRALAGEK